MDVESSIRVVIYLATIGCFLSIPLILSLFYRIILKRFIKVRSLKVFAILLLVQIVITVFLSFQPIIIYEDGVV